MCAVPVCVFEYPIDLLNAFLNLRPIIEKDKGSLEAYAENGNFSIFTPLGQVEGEYELQNYTFRVNIYKKPALIACASFGEELNRLILTQDALLKNKRPMKTKLSCAFTYPISALPAFIAVSEHIKSQNGEFEGDEKGGKFTISTPVGLIIGDYTVNSDEIEVFIRKKPFIVPCAFIQQQLNSLLKI